MCCKLSLYEFVHIAHIIHINAMRTDTLFFVWYYNFSSYVYWKNYKHARIHKHAYTHTHTLICTNIYIYVCIYARMCVYMFIWTSHARGAPIFILCVLSHCTNYYLKLNDQPNAFRLNRVYLAHSFARFLSSHSWSYSHFFFVDSQFLLLFSAYYTHIYMCARL